MPKFSAAHCIEEKYSNQITRARDVIVLLGAHNLKRSHEIGRTSFGVQNIFTHDDWNPNVASYDADIAILELAG